MASKRSYLSSGSGVNLASLREYVRKDLLDTLERAPDARATAS